MSEKYKIFYRGLLCTLMVFALSGCVSREAADAKLAKGCEAGVSAILSDGIEIDRVISTEFTPAPEGTGYRHVTLVALEKGDWLEQENTYECVFEESFGFLRANYTAAIYQIKTPNRIIGKAGGEILGSTQDFIKLTDAIRRAMYE